MHEEHVTDHQVEMVASPARPLRLRSFRGVRLAPQRIANPAMAHAFARPYRDVAQRLLDWQAQGNVELDLEPATYLHEYSQHGLTIRGLVCTIDLSTRASTMGERSVYAHEGIHPEQADELADRMHEMGINPAPILLVHHGPEQVRLLQARIMDSPPAHEFDDASGQHHRLWVVEEDADLRLIDTALAGARLMIADGHHRYAAYLRLQQRRQGTAWDRGLVMIVDQDDTPFFLGPIHRTIGAATLEELAHAAGASGAQVTWTDRSDAVGALEQNLWLATDGAKWITVDATSASAASSAVEHLHHRVLPHLEHPAQVRHHHTVDDAMSHAAPESPAVILPAPEYALLDRAMAAGTILPEKATSFQPKPNLGVLMRSVDSELMAPLAPLDSDIP